MTGKLAMLPDAVAMARRRLPALLAIVLAVAGGAFLIAGSGILANSGLASRTPVGSLTAAQLVVSGKQEVPQAEDFAAPLTQRSGVEREVADQLADRPEVAGAVGRIGVPVVPLSAQGDPMPSSLPGGAGANWEFALLGSPAVDGAAPTSAHQIAVSRELATTLDLAVGDEQSLLVAGEQSLLVVTAVVDTPGASVFFADAVAEELAGHPDKVDLIGLTVADGADPESVATMLSGSLEDSDLEVSTGADRGDAAQVGAASQRGQLLAIAGSLGGTLLLTVGFVVSAAVGISVTQQRRELALLRATGATPRQVRWLVAVQALMAALVALPVGVAGSYLLAAALGQWLDSSGILPASVQVVLGPIPALATTALLLGTVTVAALAGASRISRIAPTEAIALSQIEPRPASAVRTTIGAALLAFALVSSLVPLFLRSEAALVSASSSVLIGVIGLALAGPALVRRITGWTMVGSGSASVVRWLAAHNSQAYAGRTAGAVTVLALAIALAITQLFLLSTQAVTQRAELEAGSLQNATVSSSAGAGLTEANRADLARTEGVTGAVGMVSTTLLRTRATAAGTALDPLTTSAFSPGATEVVDPGVVEGSLAELEGDAVAMEVGAARLAGLDVGDPIELISDDGRPITAHLIATYDRGFAYGSLVTSTDLLQGATGERPYDAVLVTGDPAVIQDWAHDRPGAQLQLEEAGARSGGLLPDQWLSLVLNLVLLGYVVMGGANSLVAATTRRAGELGLLRRLGATPRQVLAMMRRETLLTAALAAAAGLALSVPAASLLGLGLLGRPWPQGPLWAIPLIVAVVVAVAYPAMMLPARRALRRPPVATLAGDR
ncbi:ABC transporter permease [Brachybacterium sp. FME24]|uniref:ABC transporter permease n=1 Tax=Brachybacterium sp. FME24 TaxID=2742605 RepID=UPI001866A23F|nr:ABC transporter permease [Brachybacterium sp. FME24]